MDGSDRSDDSNELSVSAGSPLLPETTLSIYLLGDYQESAHGLAAAISATKTVDFDWETVTWCSLWKCPLCRHKRPNKPSIVQQECPICTSDVPKTALMSCIYCSNFSCVLCRLRMISAKSPHSLREALGRVACCFCRKPYSRPELGYFDLLYDNHRNNIPFKLWATEQSPPSSVRAFGTSSSGARSEPTSWSIVGRPSVSDRSSSGSNIPHWSAIETTGLATRPTLGPRRAASNRQNRCTVCRDTQTVRHSHPRIVGDHRLVRDTISTPLSMESPALEALTQRSVDSDELVLESVPSVFLIDSQ